MGGGLGRVTKHPDYYLSDGSVSFLTGNTLFRVHQSFFERESEVFRDLFASAAEDDPQSGTDARPFTLDIKPDDFGQFLWVWYDREYSRRQTKENWVTILRLSTRWAFPKIKELAIQELEALHLPPAERISIYNEHGVDDERLFSSYVELCKSPTLPSPEDAHLIQMETLIHVLQAREDAQRRAVELGHESPTSACLEDETLREIVSRFFKTGLSPRSNGTSTGSGVQASNLNGERPQGTIANTTITLEEPQVPRKAQATRQPSLITGSEENRTENNDMHEKAGEKPHAGWVEDKAKLTTATQDKEKEEREVARQVKEREEKEKAEKAKAEKEKAEKAKEAKEKAEKVKQEQEREARERAQRAASQRQQQNPRR